MPKRSDQFQTIRTEGALLPPDILQSIASLKVDGVSPKSYHLPPGVKLNETIAQSWSVLQKHWKGFQEARRQLDPDKPGTEITNQNWLLPLFEELKYGRLTTVKSPEIDGRVYPIERFYAGQPIHLIGCNLPLDRRTTGARGAATASPHSMMQEYLNRSENGLWGFLSNGLVLRILRDNVSLSRQAYIEFNLESMMEGEVYADFALLWMLGHQSRVEADKPQNCWLEKWSQLARDLGTRVLSDLRTGVAQSIEALGRGFLSHSRNERLRDKLHSGQLSTQDFYRQLLRVVYRLLFLFVAEDRELLHPPGADEEACKRYDAFYSTRRLRELADRLRGSKHADLWQALSLVFDALGRPAGCPELGLSPLGSFLWQRSSTADLLAPAPKGSEPVAEPSLVANDDLLAAVRALAYVEQDKVRRGVDYRNLGSEELGSVYESLLELHPIVNVPARTFELSVAASNERKTTGSYYTPDSLVQCLLDSALDPVVEERLKRRRGKEAEDAILEMKVCDPACGSGHFLIAAAHRLARHLARVRTGGTEPSPEDFQHALRDVIGRCVYGVDLNPMAVELCKVSLWMEAIEPGKPLSFLDHHIQCGNSLLGTTPTLLANGVPDDAFKPIEGDIKEVVDSLKKDNRQERKDYNSGQGYLFSTSLTLETLPVTIAEIDSAADDTLEDIASKQKLYENLVQGIDYLNAQLLADTWCAAFVWKKDESDLGRLCPTERVFRSIENNPHGLNPHVREEVRRLANKYQFFHWHLGFPDVFTLDNSDKSAMHTDSGWSGGFDVALGNPPWEMCEVKDDEFFAEKAPEVLAVSSAKEKTRLIEALRTSEPSLSAAYDDYVRRVNAEKHLICNSGRYPRSSQGRINLYRLFLEAAESTSNPNGRFGMVVPTGFASDSFSAPHFRHLCESGRLCSLYDFENRERTLFPNVYYRTRFCLLTVRAEPRVDSPIDFVFMALSVSELNVDARHVLMTQKDIRTINPLTRTAPFFTSRRDFELTSACHNIGTPLASRSRSDWSISSMLMFMMNASMKAHLSADECEHMGCELVGNVYKSQECINLPLYEGKMVGMYSHRAASIRFDGSKRVRKSQAVVHGDADLSDTTRLAMPMFWVPEEQVLQRCEGYSNKWFVVVKDITSTTNERSVVAAIGPWAAYTHSVPCLFTSTNKADDSACLVAMLNSLPVDYVAKQKLAGLHLYGSVLNQLPILPLCTFEEPCPWDADMTLKGWISGRVLELSYTADDLSPFAEALGYAGKPFVWDSERRFEIQRELDAAFFHLYGFDRSMTEDAINHFRVIRDRETKEVGEFVTKSRTMELYDVLSKATKARSKYESELSPMPGWH